MSLVSLPEKRQEEEGERHICFIGCTSNSIYWSRTSDILLASPNASSKECEVNGAPGVVLF